MPRKSKISIVDYSAGSEKSVGNTITGHMVSAKHPQLSPDEATKQGIEQTCEKPILSKEPFTKEWFDSLSPELRAGLLKLQHEWRASILLNADSPDFAAWAAQRNETGRVENTPPETDTK